MIFKPGEFSSLWPFYLNALILTVSSVTLPFFTIYFMDLGFSFLQITLMTAIYGVTMFLLEVPTGAFADNHSRKYSSILGLLIISVSILLIPLTNSFILILLFWVLAGVGSTFLSGAFEAWVMDNIGDDESMRGEFFIKYQVIGSVGFIVAPLLGMWLVTFLPMTVLWYVWGGGVFVSLLFLLPIKENYVPTHEKKASVWKTSGEGFTFIKNNAFMFALIMGSVMIALIGSTADGWQPFLTDLTLPVPALGIVYSAISALGVITPFAARWLERFRLKHVLLWSSFITFLALFAIFFIVPPYYLLGIIMLGMTRTIAWLKSPLIAKAFHKHLPKKIRATVVSVESMLMQFSGAIIAVIVGWGMDVWSPQIIIASSCAFALLAMVFYRRL